MSPENFCYWLNGFIEINKPESITDEQFALIKRHLALVMNKPVMYLKPGTDTKKVDDYTALLTSQATAMVC